MSQKTIHIYLIAALLAACSDPVAPSPDSSPDADSETTDADELRDTETFDADVETDTDEPDAEQTTCQAESGDFPDPVEGRCFAVVTEEATQTVGPAGTDGHIIPGGQRLSQIGTVIELGGFPMRVIEIPGTPFVVVTDGGVSDEYLSVINTETAEIVDQEPFTRRGETAGALFLGLAASSDGSRLWVSGGGENVIVSYDVNTSTGEIVEVQERQIDAADDTDDGYVSGIALRDDGLLVINLMFGDEVLLWDTVTETEINRVRLPGGSLPFDVILSPDGSTAYVSLWADLSVVAVDLENAEIAETILVGKNPQGLAISPDGSQVLVANADSDSISTINIALGSLDDTFWTVGEEADRGSSPSALRFGGDGRLYVTNVFENAVDVLEPTETSLRRIGRIPTMWHPTDVLPLANGDMAILTGKHVGAGPNVDPGDFNIIDLMGGSIEIVEAEDLTDENIINWNDEVEINNTRMRQFNAVQCPDGADYDFPIPQPGTGPSELIRHVVLIIRENKTYDAYFGNLTNESGEPMGRGEPSLTLFEHDEIDQILVNSIALARQFSTGDNYYSHAEKSIQGHMWTTCGRTTDFVEHVWLTTSGRGYWLPAPGILDVGFPEEGSAFDYFFDNGISITNYGEIVGTRRVGFDPQYPGLFYSYEPDIEKAQYVEGRINDCHLTDFTYVLLPNDHTRGRDPGAQTPRSMIADNDEGVGRVVHALSHSTFWPETVVFIIEDDPQTGGDHIDNHRSPLIVASPWVKRGYVGQVHYDEASLYRTIQLILGLDAPHAQTWANAAPMYDLFTSTPDYTPYEHQPRQWPHEVNPDDGTWAARVSASYDWSEPDEQPGLSRILWRHLRGTEPPWQQYSDPFEDE